MKMIWLFSITWRLLATPHNFLRSHENEKGVGQSMDARVSLYKTNGDAIWCQKWATNFPESN